MVKIVTIGDLQESRVDKCSSTVKKLVIDAGSLSEQFIILLRQGEKEIKDPQQLKALIEGVRSLIRNGIEDVIFEIEATNDLDRIELGDNEE